jgi:hypothetical protein
MAISKTDVINLALALVGAKSIESPQESTKAAQLANQLWELSQNGMFALPVDWKFATARAQLAQVGQPAFGHYDYQWKLPNKCVRVLAVVASDDDTEEQDYRREVYIEVSGKDELEHDVILTEHDKCHLKYIRLREDTGKWPAWFARLVGLDLAILLCEPLKQDKPKKNQLLTMMTEPVYGWLAKAVQANAMEDMDVSDDEINLDKGNQDVLNATIIDTVKKRYIQTVET